MSSSFPSSSWFYNSFCNILAKHMNWFYKFTHGISSFFPSNIAPTMNSEPSSSSLKRKYDDTFSDSTLSKSCKRKYDVFLSFRGEDTRKGIVSHLYDALDRRGIYTYKDDERLEKGTTIAPELVKAIEESGSAIVVLSKKYADSTWCLEELLHILKYHQENDNDYKVFPVFYDVEPTQVRKQSGDFGEGFAKNREFIKGNKSKIDEWKKALNEISSKVGWDFKNDKRTEAELIKDIVKAVSTAVLPNTLSVVSKEYVGMDVRLNKVKQLLDLGSKKVLVVGIWGMGGIGKTTIAKLIFELIRNKFESSCFVVNVKEKTLEEKGLCNIQAEILHECLLESSVTIQNSLGGKMTLMDRLCGRKVFIVLDDVNRSQDLEYLIGKRVSRHRWFGEGSRIIITTRDKHLLKKNGGDYIYEMERLSFAESRQLLLQEAFEENFTSSIEEYRGAFEGILRYAGGHPLALKVLGSSLYGRNVNEWKDTLDGLEQCPDEEILGSLKVSFDALNKPEKEIFLDLCIFHKLSYYPVEEMLRSFRSNLDISISNLVSKSLITIEENYLYSELGMHDLLSEMGKLIINQESPDNPGKRSRVWNFNDLQEVLTNNKGTEAVEVICHDVICRGRHESSRLRWNINSLSKMPNLKCLISQRAIIEFPQELSMVLKKLVAIDLRYSEIMCDNIDLRIVPNLQSLNLSGVRNVHVQSVDCLKHLVHLDLSYTDIESLPSSICSLTSLQSLDLSFSKCKLPSFVVHLSNLKRLDLHGCEGLQLPNSLSGLCSLEILDLAGCELGDGAIPDDIVSLSSLKGLRLDQNIFVSIPESIFQLSQLTLLSIIGCDCLRYLPKYIPFSFKIDVENCSLLARYLPFFDTGEGRTISFMIYKSYNEIEDEVEGEESCDEIEGQIQAHISENYLFIVIWPLSEIPMGCESRESCVKTEFSTFTSAMNGYALRVVYEVVLGLDNGYSTLICNFNTNQGLLDHPLEFDIWISKRAGLYEFLIYIPMYWFGGQLNGASFLQASVDSKNSSHVIVKACNARLMPREFDDDDFYDLRLDPGSIIMTNWSGD